MEQKPLNYFWCAGDPGATRTPGYRYSHAVLRVFWNVVDVLIPWISFIRWKRAY